ELALQREQNIPFVVAQADALHRHHFCRLIRFTSRFNRFTPDMANSKCENAFRRHYTKAFRANSFRQQFAMRLEREALRSFYSRPKLVIRSGANGVSRPEYDMTRKGIALKNPIERG